MFVLVEHTQVKICCIPLLAYREQLEYLVKLEWPLLSCKNVPWAMHALSCNLDVWSAVRSGSNESSSLEVVDKDEHNQDLMDVDVGEKSAAPKEELEGTREDGELPSLLPNISVAVDVKPPHSKGSSLDHSTQLSLISKSVTPTLNKVKSRSFKNFDEDSDFLLDAESDLDEAVQIEPGPEDLAYDPFSRKAEISWVDYGIKEFRLVLSGKIGVDKRHVNLEAKVCVLFSLSLNCQWLLINMIALVLVLFSMTDQDQYGVSS